MAYTYITGEDSIALDRIKTVDGSIAEEILGVITGGNSTDVLQRKELARIMDGMRIKMPRKVGTPIPVEEYVVKFAEADTQTATDAYLETFASFKTKVNTGLQVGLYNFTDKDIRMSRPEELMRKMLNKTKKATATYTNVYKPYFSLSNLITGVTFNDTIPTLDGGTSEGFLIGKYGFARGEKYGNYLLPTATTDVRNHYLTIKGTGTTQLATADVLRAIELVKETIHYGIGGGMQEGVLVLGNPSTIQNLSFLYKDTANQDKGIFGETISMYDAYFKPIEGFHKDFLIFLDMSYEERLLVNGVNDPEVQPDQQGFGIYYENELTTFERYEDIKGAKLFIFEEEDYMPHKLSGVILDVNPTRANANGEMTTASETALNSWVASMRASYKSTI